MKRFVLFDHDGVLVDTERWYFRAGERALAEILSAADHRINAIGDLPALLACSK